nr:ORF 10.0kD [Bean golden mosaic virus]
MDVLRYLSPSPHLNEIHRLYFLRPMTHPALIRLGLVVHTLIMMRIVSISFPTSRSRHVRSRCPYWKTALIIFLLLVPGRGYLPNV